MPGLQNSGDVGQPRVSPRTGCCVASPAGAVALGVRRSARAHHDENAPFRPSRLLVYLRITAPNLALEANRTACFYFYLTDD